jgi:hypothetical protein
VNRASFALLASLVVASVFARSEAPEVTFVSPCDCQGFHGKNRWVTKTDLSPVPLDKSAIRRVDAQLHNRVSNGNRREQRRKYAR